MRKYFSSEPKTVTLGPDFSLETRTKAACVGQVTVLRGVARRRGLAVIVLAFPRGSDVPTTITVKSRLSPAQIAQTREKIDTHQRGIFRLWSSTTYPQEKAGRRTKRLRSSQLPTPTNSDHAPEATQNENGILIRTEDCCPQSVHLVASGD